MKRILWCGGSHLGNTKNSAIRRLHEGLLRDYSAEFYITAAPANRNWSARGGRYGVEGSTVFGNRTMPKERRDLSLYAAIIFVGQWIQPWFAFRDALPLSDALLRLSLEGLPLHPWITRQGHRLRWFNEPLALFPQLTEAPVILIRDPEARMEHYRLVPAAAKRRFQAHLETFCQEAGILLCPQASEALDRHLVTLPRYLRNRTGEDCVHMSDEYWQRLFVNQLEPLLRVQLQQWKGSMGATNLATARVNSSGQS